MCEPIVCTLYELRSCFSASPCYVNGYVGQTAIHRRKRHYMKIQALGNVQQVGYSPKRIHICYKPMGRKGHSIWTNQCRAILLLWLVHTKHNVKGGHHVSHNYWEWDDIAQNMNRVHKQVTKGTFRIVKCDIWAKYQVYW